MTRQPGVASAIVGATNIEQLERNVKALDVELSEAEWREVSKLATPEAASEPATKKKRAGAKQAAKGKRRS